MNASADIRLQILNFPDLGPAEGESRGTAIAGCVLTDAEIDHTSGLWMLREGCVFSIYSTPIVRRWLNEYIPIEPVLAHFAERPWRELALGAAAELSGADGEPTGLTVRAFSQDPHCPRFVNEDPEGVEGSVVGLVIEDAATGGRMVYAPGVASINPSLRSAVDGADALFIDGTFWDNEEMIRLGLGEKTGEDMGHLPVGGPEGTLAWLAGLPVRDRIFVHINNTNPMLNRTSPQAAKVERSGIRIGMDGDEFEV